MVRILTERALNSDRVTTDKWNKDNSLAQCSSCSRSTGGINQLRSRQATRRVLIPTTYYTYYTPSNLFISLCLMCSSYRSIPGCLAGGTAEETAHNFR